MNMLEENLHNVEANKSIDSVASLLHNESVARYQDVTEALTTQLTNDLGQLRAMQDEQAKIRATYLRFLDIEKQKRGLVERVETTACLLLAKGPAEGTADMRGYLENVGLVIPKDWRSHVPTWRVIAEIVRQFPKTQVVEIVRILERLGFQVTRQAVESALTTKADKFRITKRGREKFVSLR
jgi:hypothetical protein